VRGRLDPRERVSHLAVAQQQMVEIAKALSFSSDVLIMDEPTAALTDTEIDELFRITRHLRERGHGIVHISHRLEELKQITNRVTVMRDGRYIKTVDTAEATTQEIISMMVGRTVFEATPELPPDDQPLLFDFHLFDLLAALKDVLNRVPDAGIEITAEAVSITDKIATILARLESVDSMLFADLFDGSTSKAHIIATFMALLELMKNRIVRAVQIEQFGAIRLMKAVTDEIAPTSGDLFA